MSLSAAPGGQRLQTRVGMSLVDVLGAPGTPTGTGTGTGMVGTSRSATRLKLSRLRPPVAQHAPFSTYSAPAALKPAVRHAGVEPVGQLDTSHRGAGLPAGRNDLPLDVRRVAPPTRLVERALRGARLPQQQQSPVVRSRMLLTRLLQPAKLPRIDDTLWWPEQIRAGWRPFPHSTDPLSPSSTARFETLTSSRSQPSPKTSII